MVTRNLAVMFTDIKDFTARVSDGTRDDLARLQALNDQLIRPVLAHFEGTIIKSLGDAFLVTFPSPTDAVLCGVTIQEVLRRHNAQAVEADQLTVRVAINSGDVELAEGDVHGEAVNIAARLESIAEAGEVYFTEAVYLAMNRKEAPSAEVGERLFKGIPYPVRVYKVIQGPETPLARRLAGAVQLTAHGPVIRDLHIGAPAVAANAPTRRRTAPLGIGIVAALAAVGTLAWVLQPSAAERAQRHARTALQQGRSVEALAMLDEPIADSPDRADLRQLAVEAAETHSRQLADKSGAQAAFDWLERQLAQRPHLEPLRGDLPVLDAQAVVESIRQKPRGSDVWPALQQLLERHPKNAQVPYAAARGLEGWSVRLPMALYFQAIERDPKKADDHVFAFYTDKVLRLLSTGHARSAHHVIDAHYADRAEAWALRAFEERPSGQALQHARLILEKRKHPFVESPRARALIDLLDGYENQEDADRALAFFSEESDAARRRFILGLHDWVLHATDHVAGWYWMNKALIERNGKQLQQRWPEAAAP